MKINVNEFAFYLPGNSFEPVLRRFTAMTQRHPVNSTLRSGSFIVSYGLEEKRGGHGR